MAIAVVHVAVELGLPLLGICRGLQEVNVAFSGRLHQNLSVRPGGLIHWEDTSLRRDEQYRPVHPVNVTPGRLLHELVGVPSMEVNSLHRQGISCLGDNLRVEACAPDGLVEAISIAGHPGFAIAVQWHIEWFHTNPTSSAIWVGFGSACQRYLCSRPQSLGARGLR
jgi:putative glutamine amidotransferase